MIEEFVPMDRRPDDFYERFMEQRNQKINNPGKSGMEDSFPLPIEPLGTTPVKLPQKRVSNTSNEFGVNSPHVLSPAMPKTSDNSQPHPISLTPIQQFIENSENVRPRSLNIIVRSPIIWTQSRSFARALAKDTNFRILIALYTPFCMLI